MNSTIPKIKREGWCFGKIPDTWKVVPLKYVCKKSSVYGANIPSSEYVNEGIRFLRTTDICDDGTLTDEGVFINRELASSYILKEGDLLVSRSGTLGRSYLHNKNNGECAYAGYLVKFEIAKEFNPKYYFYLTKTSAFENWISQSTIEATIGNVNGEKYANLIVPVPPLNYQNRCVAFIEKEILQIDQLIKSRTNHLKLLTEKKQYLITEAVTTGFNLDANMKESKIEWLEKIPKHWDEVKLKYLGKIYYGLSQPPVYFEVGVPLIRATNVKRGEIKEEGLVYINELDVPESKKIVLKKGDIIVVRSGAYTADSAMVTEKWEGSIAGFDMILKPSKHIHPEFLAKVLLSQYVLDYQLIPSSSRAAQPHLNAEELGCVKIALPPLTEQIDIVDKLESELRSIYELEERTKLSISLLKERRDCLISEAVTGQIEM